MTKKLFIYLNLFLIMTLSQTLKAGSGNIFNVVGIGTPGTIAITLCLDGSALLSCQNYLVTSLSLVISTVIPNHTYPRAGIKINTPGYTPSGCTTISNGYCLFSVNKTTPNTITVSSIIMPLSVSVATLALRTSGVARNMTITNNGIYAATHVTYNPSPALPSGTTISPASCGTIPPAGSCTLTITPGVTPSAEAGNTSPTPITLTIVGDNTNTLTPTISVLTYGSVYQSGYVYAIDDTTPTNASIGGKVAALTDQANLYPFGVVWSSNGTVGQVDNFNIPGIYENSTAGVNSCNGNTDGACDSTQILNHYLSTDSYPVSFYPAGTCSVTIGDYSDWYLPAMCEMGYDSLSVGSGCGSAISPTLQNMQSNLVDNGNIGSLSGSYWSSTEYSASPTNDAWTQFFATSGLSSQGITIKSNPYAVRCSRALTS